MVGYASSQTLGRIFDVRLLALTSLTTIARCSTLGDVRRAAGRCAALRAWQQHGNAPILRRKPAETSYPPRSFLRITPRSSRRATCSRTGDVQGTQRSVPNGEANILWVSVFYERRGALQWASARATCNIGGIQRPKTIVTWSSVEIGRTAADPRTPSLSNASL